MGADRSPTLRHRRAPLCVSLPAFFVSVIVLAGSGDQKMLETERSI